MGHCPAGVFRCSNLPQVPYSKHHAPSRCTHARTHTHMRTQKSRHTDADTQTRRHRERHHTQFSNTSPRATCAHSHYKKLFDSSGPSTPTSNKAATMQHTVPPGQVCSPFSFVYRHPNNTTLRLRLACLPRSLRLCPILHASVCTAALHA